VGFRDRFRMHIGFGRYRRDHGSCILPHRRKARFHSNVTGCVSGFSPLAGRRPAGTLLEAGWSPMMGSEG
jgi:hypothetical protein